MYLFQHKKYVVRYQDITFGCTWRLMNCKRKSSRHTTMPFCTMLLETRWNCFHCQYYKCWEVCCTLVNGFCRSPCWRVVLRLEEYKWPYGGMWGHGVDCQFYNFSIPKYWIHPWFMSYIGKCWKGCWSNAIKCEVSLRWGIVSSLWVYDIAGLFFRHQLTWYFPLTVTKLFHRGVPVFSAPRNCAFWK